MKTIIPRFILSFLFASYLVISGTGCKHTAHGTGKDIENMGEKIQDKTK